VRPASEARDVHQHATRDDPLLCVGDAEPGAPRRGVHRCAREAVVHDAIEGVVAERVHVAVGITVVGDRIAIAQVARGRIAEQLGAPRRGRIGGPLLQVVVRQRHGDPLLHEASRPHPMLRGDEVQRAQLVVGAPPSPVGQLGHPAVDGLARDIRHLLRGQVRRGGPNRSCQEQSDGGGEGAPHGATSNHSEPLHRWLALPR